MRDELLVFHDDSTVTSAGGEDTGNALAVGPLNQRPLAIEVNYSSSQVGTGESDGTMTLVCQQSDASDGTYEPITNSKVVTLTADGDASGQVIFTVYPSKKYVQLSVTVAGIGGTADVLATGGIGLQGTRQWGY
jgi:hypothetical protein